MNNKRTMRNVTFPMIATRRGTALLLASIVLCASSSSIEKSSARAMDRLLSVGREEFKTVVLRKSFSFDPYFQEMMFSKLSLGCGANIL